MKRLSCFSLMLACALFMGMYQVEAATTDITENFSSILPPGVQMKEDENGRLEFHQTVVCDASTGKLKGDPGFLPPELWQEYEKRCQRQSTWWGRIFNEIEAWWKNR